MSWGAGEDSWGGGADTAAAATGDDSWGGGNTGGAAGAADAGGDWGGGGGDAGGGSGDGACRICSEQGHFARDCPQKPEGGGLTGECYNCGQVGHNKADCPNPKVDRPFTGTCNSCGVEGHAARSCPSNPMKCRLCGEEGHKAMECKSRRLVNWNGVPEISSQEAWSKLIDGAAAKDLDVFRVALKAYARATMDDFSLVAVEQALRDGGLPIYLIAMKQDIAKNMTIVDITGLPDREYVLSIQYSAKPRRQKHGTGWPADPAENLERLTSAGYVQDCGVPLCGNCGELGHIRKHCTQEKVEMESTAPTVVCVYCKEEGHRARDCPKERVNPFACRNCKQEGHRSNECPEPRSAEGVECHKCSQTGHFSRDVSIVTCHSGFLLLIVSSALTSKPALRVHAAIADLRIILPRNVTSRVIPIPLHAATARRWAISAGTAPSRRTGPRSSAPTAARWVTLSSAAKFLSPRMVDLVRVVRSVRVLLSRHRVVGILLLLTLLCLLVVRPPGTLVVAGKQILRPMMTMSC
ncbi:hypothetical protein CC80DRAFT_228916 [Byssothecium circinans]|uniref:CCHC-type domain-containing protein n=1 Tax=Byssothecium circinans TaxID=147558 RepID=A0A6A5TE26_9PLEO|nr:hypothetical protein CC80DRAFT_228916 [Byssothecium circinans]